MQEEILRVCTSCKKEKKSAEFHSGKGYADTLRKICKRCQSRDSVEASRIRTKKAFYEKVTAFVKELEDQEYSSQSDDDKIEIFIKTLIENQLGLKKHSPCWDIDL